MIGAGLRLAPKAAPLLVALTFTIGCGSQESSQTTSEDDAGSEQRTQQASESIGGQKKVAVTKDYECPGAIKLNGVVTATRIETVGVPCDEVEEILSDNSKSDFTCFLTGASARCTDGRRTIEYEQG